MICRIGKIAALVLVISLLPVAAANAADEWKSLFNGTDLAGWKEHGSTGQWSVKDGLMHCKGSGGGGIFTEKEYANFEVELEFRLAKGGNSGVWIRAPLEGNPSYTGMEIQLLDDNAKQYAHLHPEQYCGSIYDVVAAKRDFTKPAGEWSKIDIRAEGRMIKVTLNGTVIVDADLDKHKGKEPTHPGLKRTTGHIGLQNHTDPLDFRNLRVRELP